MLRLARDDAAMFAEPAPRATGHAAEARVYAENPAADYRPSPGLVTAVVVPGRMRVDGWIDGSEVTGRLDLAIEDGTFAWAEHEAFLRVEAEGIAEFRARQATAFAGERAAWEAAGEFAPRPEPELRAADSSQVGLPPGGVLVEAPISASVWRVEVEPGDDVSAGGRLLTLEAMKTETALESPVDGEVAVLARPGDQVVSGHALVVIAPSSAG